MAVTLVLYTDGAARGNPGLASIPSVVFEHVVREDNRVADGLANAALDR
jgi:ribonuclease HI